MSAYRIGFIGVGQMGGALLRGFLEAGLVGPENVWISETDAERLKKLCEDFGVNPARSNRETAENADVVILAVKPQQLLDVVDDLAPVLTAEKVVITIAAGMTTEKIMSRLGKGLRLVRVMPNSPALVGESASVVSPSKGADREAVELALELFRSVGEVVELPEEFQNRVTAISGSGPAYFYYLVEALVETAVEIGIPADIAEKLVIQTMGGSADMFVETGRRPKELRSMVTSPGGTTEAAIKTFEEADFRGLVRDAVTAAIRRAEELAK
ncbi:MAG: pyrroline-5-carboxylate reductase [Actinobacteria bacterium]|nr:pyrroline-5-carboxylate reductase [Actinomycetota bacterium]